VAARAPRRRSGAAPPRTEADPRRQPNTTARSRELLARRIGAAIGAAAEVEAITARFGAAYIASEASYVVARTPRSTPAARAATPTAGPTRSSSAAFGDPGVVSAARGARAAVVGLAEAAMREPASARPVRDRHRRRRWGPMLIAAGARARARRSAGDDRDRRRDRGRAGRPIPSARSPFSATPASARRQGADAVVLGGGGARRHGRGDRRARR
jgi:hypothetical protein